MSMSSVADKHKKTIMTVSGIRPDFIRMSEIFRKLDDSNWANHILVHTGQHYDELLSGVFFKELNIRKPDYTLNTGSEKGKHHHQLGYLSVAIIELIEKENLKPDIILFLGDSNTVCAALPLRKEGYIIGHIEAGMRSFDKRMLEEINRTVCDHCSHIHFVYHPEYKRFLENENIDSKDIYVVGNTITEVCLPYVPTIPKRRDMILVDIHRPENFKYQKRMTAILKYAAMSSIMFNIPVKILDFKRTTAAINEYGLENMILGEGYHTDQGSIEMIDLMSYRQYLDCIYHCKFIISDSGTAQEEPALFGTPVVVPRDYTERPQSVTYNCSYMFNANSLEKANESWEWVKSVDAGVTKMDTRWLGDGKTSELVVSGLRSYLTL
tara:strand:- start:5823 stop:6965 length:1143 start_codon:yes stop_codon:yes gene_type:complete